MYHIEKDNARPETMNRAAPRHPNALFPAQQLKCSALQQTVIYYHISSLLREIPSVLKLQTIWNKDIFSIE